MSGLVETVPSFTVIIVDESRDGEAQFQCISPPRVGDGVTVREEGATIIDGVVRDVHWSFDTGRRKPVVSVYVEGRP